MFIPDPNFSIPDSDPRSKRFRILGLETHQRIKYFLPKNFFSALGNMIRDVHPGFGSLFFPYAGSRGQKRHRIPDPDPQHCCLLWHLFWFWQCVVQVDNTDAEGRLILADALCYADQFDPRCGSWQPESCFTTILRIIFILFFFLSLGWSWMLQHWREPSVLL